MLKDPIQSFNDPKMLELLKEINKTKEEIANTTDDIQKDKLKKKLNDQQMHYNILSERRGPG